MPSPPRRRTTLALALGLVGTLVAAACSGGSGGSGDADDAGDESAGPAAGSQVADSDTTLEPFDGGDFYAVPDPLPEGAPGDLIRYEPIDDSPVVGAAAWRVMYLSESVEGDPIAVTGTVFVPRSAAPDAGRDIVTLAHGTRGIADECAPSKEGGGAESALAGLAVERGYILAVTDYEGLGTPGRHPYLVGESEGRSVLDAAKATRQLPDAEASDRLAIAGYSQGGHGALWAGELAEEWSPELDLVGTFAGAPATELPLIFDAAGSTPIAGFLYMIVAGFQAAYPDEADPALLMTPEGVDELDAVDQGCTAEILRHFARIPGSDLLKPDVGSVEPWATLTAENDPGQVDTGSPILIIHSAADDVVPAALSQLLFDRMCGLGQEVERRVYDEGQSHIEAAPPAYADAMDWIDARFAGEPATSTCP
jgi:fermentation-respiration switch protein FrsA (DUF1100 family)